MKLKTLLIFGLLFTICHVSNAQTLKKTTDYGRIGITFSSFGNNDIIYFGKVVGSASYDGENFFSVGINYIYPLKNWLELEAAVEYSEFTMRVNPPFYPGINIDPYNTEVTILNIPIGLRANFFKYFYANGGLLFGFDISDSNSIDNQSGIGGILGIGARYDFDFGASIFINPYIKMHSVVPFSKEGSIHQRLTESGIRFGITYQITGS